MEWRELIHPNIASPQPHTPTPTQILSPPPPPSPTWAHTHTHINSQKQQSEGFGLGSDWFGGAEIAGWKDGGDFSICQQIRDDWRLSGAQLHTVCFNKHMACTKHLTITAERTPCSDAGGGKNLNEEKLLMWDKNKGRHHSTGVFASDKFRAASALFSRKIWFSKKAFHSGGGFVVWNWICGSAPVRRCTGAGFGIGRSQSRKKRRTNALDSLQLTLKMEHAWRCPDFTGPSIIWVGSLSQPSTSSFLKSFPELMLRPISVCRSQISTDYYRECWQGGELRWKVEQRRRKFFKHEHKKKLIHVTDEVRVYLSGLKVGLTSNRVWLRLHILVQIQPILPD